MDTKSFANLFTGSFLSDEKSEVQIELPFTCEKLNITKNGQISYIQNIVISTWGSLDPNTSFSCSYHLCLNSYTLQEDVEGKDVYQATVNNINLISSTDNYYLSPIRNNVGIEVYPKYSPLGKRIEGNQGTIKIPLVSKNKDGEIKNILPNVQIYWSILILG